ncbi:MAG TPA: hypothetical protein DD397_06885 [Hyphomonas sp.]|jgi:hypothetical protein|uniref:hypothetical protein n=1 Tax=Hyphomonas sp. TaxID=87 RepID=UPI000E960FB0|nr:hypothetical protein [Hyphomonas sp.]QDP49056.1 MAG: hypothetical protein Unbinned4811contig1001_1 [Prokaryotic dsDNA virus sp.]HBN92271.1 hypothetical protein [Hyphomonas sp.]|tara:strand:- start:472 stop:783 length:312 start_codon:yes stop_codon:yes gene_type:complete
MSTHFGTIDIPVRDDLVIPDVEYQCRVSEDKNGDPVIEDIEVSLWSKSQNAFTWVEPTAQMYALIDADVVKAHSEGRIDIDTWEPHEVRTPVLHVNLNAVAQH